MKQRIVSALQWSVALLAMLISGAVFWQQTQMLAEMRQARQEEAAQRKEDAAQRQALTAKLDQLQLQARALQPVAEAPGLSMDTPLAEAVETKTESVPPQLADAPPFDAPRSDAFTSEPEPPSNLPVAKPQLTVKLVQGTADGPPFTAGVAQITISDNRGTHLTADPIPSSLPPNLRPLNRSTEEDHIGVPEPVGPIIYGVYESLDPSHYELSVKLADGQRSTRPLLIRDNNPLELTIVCPPPREKASLQISVPPLPEELREAALYLNVTIDERPVTLGEDEWLSSSDIAQELTFDPRTAKAIGLTRKDSRLDESDQRISLSKLKPEDCLVFVDSGTIALSFQLGLLGPPLGPDGPRNVYPVRYPGESQTADALLRDVQPGANRWQIELPEALLAEARAMLKSLSSNNVPVYDAPVAPAPAPAIRPVSASKAPQLTIKCVPEREDGPAVKVQNVTIRSAEVEAGAERVSSGEGELYVFDALPPDQYELTIVLADNQNQMCTQPLLVEDEKPRELRIVCPGPRKKVPVQVTLQSLPEKLRKLHFETVQMTVFAGPLEVGKNRWMTPNLASQTITFDTTTGLPRAVEITTTRGEQHFDLSELPADERRVFLPVGTVVYHFNMHERTVGSRSVPVFYWPKSRQEDDCLKHVIQGDEKSWKPELPQEYLDEIPSKLNREVPIPELRSNNRPNPNPYAHENGFKWVRGVARFDDANNTWSVVYNPEPDSRDPYSGSLTLALDPRPAGRIGREINRLMPDDVVLVQGKVDDSRLDQFGKPKYYVSDLTRLVPKPKPIDGP